VIRRAFLIAIKARRETFCAAPGTVCRRNPHDILRRGHSLSVQAAMREHRIQEGTR
jgi:hypothetical protein